MTGSTILVANRAVVELNKLPADGSVTSGTLCAVRAVVNIIGAMTRDALRCNFYAHSIDMARRARYVCMTIDEWEEGVRQRRLHGTRLWHGDRRGQLPSRGWFLQ